MSKTIKIIIELGQTFSIYNDDDNLISKVKCIEDDAYACKSCVFMNTTTCDSIECNGCLRPDGTDIHFEYIGL